MKKRKIKLKIVSEQYDIADELIDELIGESEGDTENEDSNYEIDNIISNADEKVINNDEPEKIEIYTDAEIKDDGKRIEISYEETELTGMKDSKTAISFQKDTPELVAMLRDGSVYTALVFEPGKRNICAYETPYMPFELCIYTQKVDNKMSFDGGSIYLDYVIEIRGAKAERTKFYIEIV